MNQQEEINLLRYIQIIDKRKWLILLIIIVSMGTTYLIGSFSGVTYEAISVFKLSENPVIRIPGQKMTVLIDRKPDSIILGMTSDIVLDKVRKKLRLKEDLNAIRGLVSIEIVPETNFVKVHTVDSSPEKAALIANSLTKYFVDENKTFDKNKREAIQKELKRNEDQLNDIIAQEKTLKKAIEEAPGLNIDSKDKSLIIAYNRQALSALQQPKYLVSQDADVLKKQFSEMDLIEVTTKAVVPTKPVERPLLFNVIFAGVLAVVGGIGISFGMEYLSENRK
ncbi:MAG: hypothetical protein HY776_05540 [Actinobacteria bacterium]|nr:hypothetical protein [Actinomycetota bacterium]